MKTDPEDPDVGQRTWLVGRDTRDQPEFKYASDPREMSSPEPGLKRRGVGDLHSEATDEIRERLDLEDHVGEEVATVTVDVDAWEYRIEWLVDDEPRGLVERARRFYRKSLKGETVDGGNT